MKIYTSSMRSTNHRNETLGELTLCFVAQINLQHPLSVGGLAKIFTAGLIISFFYFTFLWANQKGFWIEPKNTCLRCDCNTSSQPQMMGGIMGPVHQPPAITDSLIITYLFKFCVRLCSCSCWNGSLSGAQVKNSRSPLLLLLLPTDWVVLVLQRRLVFHIWAIMCLRKTREHSASLLVCRWSRFMTSLHFEFVIVPRSHNWRWTVHNNVFCVCHIMYLSHFFISINAKESTYIYKFKCPTTTSNCINCQSFKQINITSNI